MLFSVISVLIALMGLLGLISFMAIQRKKEIGIRKTFGSSSFNIVFLICKDILKLIILASVISWPITYVLMDKWLQDFAYRVNINIALFFIIPSITAIISLILVIYKAIEAAYKNPVETLRYE